MYDDILTVYTVPLSYCTDNILEFYQRIVMSLLVNMTVGLQNNNNFEVCYDFWESGPIFYLEDEIDNNYVYFGNSEKYFMLKPLDNTLNNNTPYLFFVSASNYSLREYLA